MKKIFLVMTGLWVALFSQAQVIVSTQLPPLGLTIKSQLWNLSLINTGSVSLDIKIEVSVTDISNNQPVLTGTSRLLTLPRGPKQFRIADVLPIVYNLGNPGYRVDPNPDGFLPIGQFNICYTIIKSNSDAPEVLSEECQSVEVEPLSPPQLIIPLDNEDIGIMRPFFAWVPPSPFNSYNSLLYDWVLVEVQATQSPADAVQQNVPILTRQNISFTSFQYPLSMPELDTSKVYAWRVVAKNYTSPIATSETWSFKVKHYEPDSVIASADGFFARLHRQEDASFIICNGVLRFEYMNDNNMSMAAVNIFDISSAGRRVVPLDSADYRVAYGQNFIQIDLRQKNMMMNGHMYLLELRNAKNETWYLKFEFRKP
jgi:hypothetical protein